MGKFFKKWGLLVVSLFFMCIIVVLTLLGFGSVSKYKKAVGELNGQVMSLESSLNDIGPLVTGYVTTANVRAGEEITEDKIMAVSVPEKLSLEVYTSPDEILGRYFKIALKESTVITKEDVIEEKLDNTWRYYDMVLDETPIGIVAGDYIDIRISFPFGEDFIAISHKKVEEINSGILKLVVNEYDLMAYNSMLLDKALYSGAKIYAIKYIDGGAQAGAEKFYPVQQNLSLISKLDPNILEEVKQEMILKRQVLDNAIGGTIDTKTEQELDRVKYNIEATRSAINNNLVSAQKELEQRLEMEAEEAARASMN